MGQQGGIDCRVRGQKGEKGVTSHGCRTQQCEVHGATDLWGQPRYFVVLHAMFRAPRTLLADSRSAVLALPNVGCHTFAPLARAHLRTATRVQMCRCVILWVMRLMSDCYRPRLNFTVPRISMYNLPYLIIASWSNSESFLEEMLSNGKCSSCKLRLSLTCT